MWAAMMGRTETVLALIAANADVHAKNNGGYTALMRAAENGHTEIVLALIAANADVHAKDNVSEL